MKKLILALCFLTLSGCGLCCVCGPGLSPKLVALEKTNPCVAQTIYLCELYRDLGYPVRVRTGIRTTGGQHAQGQAYHDGNWHNLRYTNTLTGGQCGCFGPSELIRADVYSLEQFKGKYL